MEELRDRGLRNQNRIYIIDFNLLNMVFQNEPDGNTVRNWRKELVYEESHFVYRNEPGWLYRR